MDFFYEFCKFFSKKRYFRDYRRAAGWPWQLYFVLLLGDVHILRNAIFQLFSPPLPLVTKNRTNPHVLTTVRNKSLTPLPPLERYVICGPPLKHLGFGKIFSKINSNFINLI
jgi:hypothetical protein